MIGIDYSFTDLSDNVTFDEVLLQLADKHHQGECIRFWEAPHYGVVVGRIGKIAEEVHETVAQSKQLPIVRRSSGGGTVLQGPGCLNYTLVLSKKRHADLSDLRASYTWISEQLIYILKMLGVEAVFYPISDLATPLGKKFSGNAQHRGKNYILHHGTLLYDFNLELISTFLPKPPYEPDYRQGREHQAFVTNVSVNPRQFKQALFEHFDCKSQTQTLTKEQLTFLKNFPRIS